MPNERDHGHPPATAAPIKLDVLAWKPFRALLIRPVFPLLFQGFALVMIVILVAVGLGAGLSLPAEQLMTLRKTNLTTLVVWGLWWPGMIAVAVMFGRVWCTVCPMELVNRIGEELGRRSGWSRLGLGRFLRAGWLVLVLYLTLQLLVAGVSIHRVPHFTALLLLVLLAAALVSGLVFGESRSFCKALCPASALLSVYGRYTPVQLEMRDASQCERCRTRDCVRAQYRFRLDRRSCPSLLRPFQRQASDPCVLCFQCAKVCPHQNVGFGLVSKDRTIRRHVLLRPYEAVFVMVALGFVSHEVIGEVKGLDAVFHAVPKAWAGFWPGIPFGWFEALWYLVVFPLAFWSVIAGIGYVAGDRRGIRALLLSAATGAAPVIAVAHLAKAAAKFTSWGTFLPLAVRDPRGLDTLEGIATGSIAAPASLLQLNGLGWAMLILIVFMACKAWRWGRLIPTESLAASRTGLAGAAVLFGTVLTIWSWSGT